MLPHQLQYYHQSGLLFFKRLLFFEIPRIYFGFCIILLHKLSQIQ